VSPLVKPPAYKAGGRGGGSLVAVEGNSKLLHESLPCSNMSQPASSFSAVSHTVPTSADRESGTFNSLTARFHEILVHILNGELDLTTVESEFISIIGRKKDASILTSFLSDWERQNTARAKMHLCQEYYRRTIRPEWDDRISSRFQTEFRRYLPDIPQTFPEDVLTRVLEIFAGEEATYQMFRINNREAIWVNWVDHERFQQYRHCD
jgi:hypothetical protein